MEETLSDIDDMWEEIEKEEKNYPIKTKIKRVGYWIERTYEDIRYFFRSNWFFLWHGFKPHDWWGFYTHNAKRTSKILKYFLKHTIMDLKCPVQREFGKALPEMIKGFEIIGKDDFEFPISISIRKKLCKKYPKLFKMKELLRQEKNYHKADRALKLFAKYYFWLWD